MASINGNEILENLKIARNKTPKHFGTISQNGKVLASAQGSKPVEAEPIKHKLSPKQSFLNQIQNYNDFIVQNDLDAEKINPGHDYDFTAFTSPEDWKVESQRLKDRFSDRQAEIKQNANNGEFQGLELEGGMPSYEITQNMSPEQYAEYEAKYLTPSKGESLQETQVQQSKHRQANANVFDRIEQQIKADEARPEFSKELVALKALQNEQRNGKPRYTSAGSHRDELNITQPRKEVQALQDANKPSAFDRIKSLVAVQMFPVAKGIASTVGSVARLKKQYEKEGAGSVLEDVGSGTMARLAAPFSDSSSKFWKDRLNTKDGEAGNVGSAVADEAMMGLGGGFLGRAVGTGYKSMRRGGEMLRHRATKAGKARQKLANDHIDYGHKFLTNIGMPSNIAKGKISAKDAEGTAHRVYENMSKPLKHKPYGGSESLGSTLTHNIRRKLDSRAMLQRNDNEINSLFDQGKTLKQAKSHQKKHWESQPNQYQQIGAVMGGGLGLAGNTGL